MKRLVFLGIIGASCVSAASVTAGTIDASAVLTVKVDGADWDYSIKLTNTSGAGNDGIETFWYAWTPGQDYLDSKPFDVVTPTGWSSTITGAGSTTDGYAIRFETTSDVLNPGNLLTFAFTSADTPEELADDSIFHNHPPVGTSFV